MTTSGDILQEIQELFKRNQFDQILHIIQNAEDQNLLSLVGEEEDIPALPIILIILKILYYKARIQEYFILQEQSYETAKLIYLFAEKYNIPSGKLDALYIQGLLAFPNLDFDSISNILLEVNRILVEVPDQGMKEEYKVRFLLIEAFRLCWGKNRDIEAAHSHMMKALQFSEKEKDLIFTRRTLSLFAEIKHVMGDYQNALVYAKKCLQKQTQRNNIVSLLNYNYLGILYTIMGLLDKALDNYFQVLSISQDLNYSQMKGIAMANIGTIYNQQGFLDKALTVYKENLQFINPIKRKINIALVYHAIIDIALIQENQDEVETYMEKFRELDAIEDDNEIHHYYQYNLAKNLMKSRRSRDRVKAEQVLREILENKQLSFTLSKNISLDLCELLLYELKISEDPEIVIEISGIIQSLHNFAEKNNIFATLPFILSIEAQLAVLQNKFSEAKYFFLAAQNIAEAHNLKRIALQISKKFDQFLILEEKYKIDEVFSKKMSFTQKLELIEFEQTISEQQFGSLNMSIDELPILLSIFSKAGHIIFSHSFDNVVKYDNQLFGMLLSTINIFSTELFAESVERVKMGKFIVMMLPFESMVLSYVIKGDSYIAQKRIMEFAERIRLDPKIWEKLERAFSHNELLEEDAFSELLALINKIFIGKLAKDYLES